LIAGGATMRPALAVKVCAWSIQVEMIDKVQSRSSKAGWPFTFRVTEDAVAQDGTRIPAGTMGYGLIRSADPAGRHNHDGSLAI
jgi:hypothetical protein